MSLSASNEYLSKADQISFKYFNKVLLLINHARATPLQQQTKIEKWVRYTLDSLFALFDLYLYSLI